MLKQGSHLFWCLISTSAVAWAHDPPWGHPALLMLEFEGFDRGSAASIHHASRNTEEVVQQCSLCFDGSSIGFPDKVPGYGFNGTCAEIEQEAAQAADAAECETFSFVAGICGCPTTATNPCKSCKGGTFTPDVVVQSLQIIGLPPMSCSDFELFAAQFEESGEVCYGANYFAYLCGCENKDVLERKLLAWITRSAGILSALASLAIIVDIVRLRKKRRNKFTAYQQLVGAMSAFDVLSSAGWALSTLPIPALNVYGEQEAVYGAKGNEATCTAQGFLVQLGFTGRSLSMVLRGRVDASRFRRYGTSLTSLLSSRRYLVQHFPLHLLRSPDSVRLATRPYQEELAMAASFPSCCGYRIRYVD